MFTVFFNGTGECKISIPLDGGISKRVFCGLLAYHFSGMDTAIASML
jgi:hypothetical protein